MTRLQSSHELQHRQRKNHGIVEIIEKLRNICGIIQVLEYHWNAAVMTQREQPRVHRVKEKDLLIFHIHVRQLESQCSMKFSLSPRIIYNTQQRRLMLHTKFPTREKWNERENYKEWDEEERKLYFFLDRSITQIMLSWRDKRWEMEGENRSCSDGSHNTYTHESSQL